MKKLFTIPTLLMAFAMMIGFSASAQEKAKIKIRKDVNGNIEIIEKEIELKDGEDIELLLQELGVMNELGEINAGEGFEIAVRKLGRDGQEEQNISFYPEKNSNKAFLGVMINTIHDAPGQGAVISDIIEDTAASESELQAGDVIVGINRNDISGYKDLVEALSELKPGDKATIHYLREGKKGKTKVELGNAKESNNLDFNWDIEWHDEEGGNIFFRDSEEGFPWMGSKDFQLEEFELEEQAFLGVTPGSSSEEGVRLGSVIEDSSAESAGIEPGDIVVKIDGVETNDFGTLGDQISSKNPGDKITLEILREGQPMTIEAELGSREVKSFGDIRMIPNFKGQDESGDIHFDFEFDLDSAGQDLDQLMKGLGELGAGFSEITEGLEGLGEGLSGMMIAIDSTMQVFKFEEHRPPGFVVTDEISISFDIDNVSEEEAATINQTADTKLHISNDLEMELISFFPNPTQGQFVLKFDLVNEEPARVMLYNQQGAIVYDELVNNPTDVYRNTLDISNESDGTYFLQILQGDKAYSKKIVKGS